MEKFTKKITLWKKDWITYWIDAPKRDCGWYWGAWYVETDHSHQHFNNIGMQLLVWRNNDEEMLDEFSPKLVNKNDRRDLIAIFKHIYHLRERAEFLKNWWHVNNLSIELLDIIWWENERKLEIEKINNELLPKLFYMIEKYAD